MRLDRDINRKCILSSLDKFFFFSSYFPSPFFSFSKTRGSDMSMKRGVAHRKVLHLFKSAPGELTFFLNFISPRRTPRLKHPDEYRQTRFYVFTASLFVSLFALIFGIFLPRIWRRGTIRCRNWSVYLHMDLYREIDAWRRKDGFY